MENRPYIVCDNLVKIYKVEELEVVALQGLDLTVDRGEMLGVIGPSGSGKSTLMNILGGLDRPSAGRAWVADQDLLKTSNSGLNRYRRTQVGFVWQQSARNLVPYLNAFENITLPMTLAGVKERQKQTWSNQLLEMVGLGNRKYHLLSQMSGGEQQRVAIAVSLANRPGLLLADEPTGEVDEETGLTIYRIFKELNQQLGITILIVSHDPGIARHVNRVVAIRDGKLATETVRRSSFSNGDSQNQLLDDENETEYEELIVLDAAGRLQLPQDYLEQLAIEKRVRLELVDGGILIRPVVNDVVKEKTRAVHDNATRINEQKPDRAGSGLIQRTLNKLRERRSKNLQEDQPSADESSQERKS
jgi:putative ABC transport system ATP-binding protein